MGVYEIKKLLVLTENARRGIYSMDVETISFLGII